MRWPASWRRRQPLGSPGERERLPRRPATGRQEGRRRRRGHRGPSPAAAVDRRRSGRARHYPVGDPGRRGHDRNHLGMREFRDGDLEDAWSSIAATDDPEVNAAVVAEAERRHIFCVRADAAVRAPRSARRPSIRRAVRRRAGRRSAPPLGVHPVGPRRSVPPRWITAETLRPARGSWPSSAAVRRPGTDHRPRPPAAGPRRCRRRRPAGPPELLGELAPHVEVIDAARSRTAGRWPRTARRGADRPRQAASSWCG